MNDQVKIAITGAAGQIGYALLFRIASGQIFGPNTDVELRLLELPQAMSALEGVAMELDDCAFPLLKNIVCTDDVNQVMEGVNYAALVGSVPRKDGMERADLLKINGGIFTTQGRAINEHAADDVNVFVVGNPCNTNCLIAMHSAPDVPNQRFFAMTSLDENRARTQLAKKANVPVTAVSRMTIWGNHSASQYPDFYNARINNQPVVEVISDEAWLKDTFIPTVQKRGAAVIKARGASSAASAANAVVDGIHRLVTDTPDGDTFSVARVVDFDYEYGPGKSIDKDLIFSMPCQVKSGELQVVTDIQHNEFGQAMIEKTLAELKNERDMVREAGLIE